MLRNRIVEVAVIEGMAASDAFDGHPTTTEKSKTVYCLISIM
jgi:hypothetical protein